MGSLGEVEYFEISPRNQYSFIKVFIAVVDGDISPIIRVIGSGSGLFVFNGRGLERTHYLEKHSSRDVDRLIVDYMKGVWK